MKLFILGATGGIGRHLVRRLLEQGHSVTAYVRSPQKIGTAHASLQVVPGDVFDADEMADLLDPADQNRIERALLETGHLIIPEHLRAAHWRGFEAAMTNGVMTLQGRPTLTRATHQTGRKLYVEMTFALVKAPDGTALGSVAVARDVTERVERERAARSVSTDSKRN